jgi:hypothetical protein
MEFASGRGGETSWAELLDGGVALLFAEGDRLRERDEEGTRKEWMVDVTRCVRFRNDSVMADTRFLPISS